jgi:hypothetical protein
VSAVSIPSKSKTSSQSARFAYSGDAHVYIFEQVSNTYRLEHVIPFTNKLVLNKGLSNKKSGADLTDEFAWQREVIHDAFYRSQFKDDAKNQLALFNQVKNQEIAQWGGTGIACL